MSQDQKSVKKSKLAWIIGASCALVLLAVVVIIFNVLRTNDLKLNGKKITGGQKGFLNYIFGDNYKTLESSNTEEGLVSLRKSAYLRARMLSSEAKVFDTIEAAKDRLNALLASKEFTQKLYIPSAPAEKTKEADLYTEVIAPAYNMLITSIFDKGKGQSLVLPSKYFHAPENHEAVETFAELICENAVIGGLKKNVFTEKQEGDEKSYTYALEFRTEVSRKRNEIEEFIDDHRIVHIICQIINSISTWTVDMNYYGENCKIEGSFSAKNRERLCIIASNLFHKKGLYKAQDLKFGVQDLIFRENAAKYYPGKIGSDLLLWAFDCSEEKYLTEELIKKRINYVQGLVAAYSAHAARNKLTADEINLTKGNINYGLGEDEDIRVKDDYAGADLNVSQKPDYEEIRQKFIDEIKSLIKSRFPHNKDLPELIK